MLRYTRPQKLKNLCTHTRRVRPRRTFADQPQREGNPNQILSLLEAFKSNTAQSQKFKLEDVITTMGKPSEARTSTSESLADSLERTMQITPEESAQSTETLNDIEDIVESTYIDEELDEDENDEPFFEEPFSEAEMKGILEAESKRQQSGAKPDDIPNAEDMPGVFGDPAIEVGKNRNEMRRALKIQRELFEKDKADLDALQKIRVEQDLLITSAMGADTPIVIDRKQFAIMQLQRMGFVGTLIPVGGYVNQMLSEYLQLDAYLLNVKYIYKNARQMEMLVLWPEFKKRLELLGLSTSGDFIVCRNRFYMHVFGELPHPKRALPKVIKNAAEIKFSQSSVLMDKYYQKVLRMAHGPSQIVPGDPSDPDFRKYLRLFKEEYDGDPATYRTHYESAMGTLVIPETVEDEELDDPEAREHLFVGSPYEGGSQRYSLVPLTQEEQLRLELRQEFKERPFIYSDYSDIAAEQEHLFRSREKYYSPNQRFLERALSPDITRDEMDVHEPLKVIRPGEEEDEDGGSDENYNAPGPSRLLQEDLDYENENNNNEQSSNSAGGQRYSSGPSSYTPSAASSGTKQAYTTPDISNLLNFSGKAESPKKVRTSAPTKKINNDKFAKQNTNIMSENPTMNDRVTTILKKLDQLSRNKQHNELSSAMLKEKTNVETTEPQPKNLFEQIYSDDKIDPKQLLEEIKKVNAFMDSKQIQPKSKLGKKVLNITPTEIPPEKLATTEEAPKVNILDVNAPPVDSFWYDPPIERQIKHKIATAKKPFSPDALRRKMFKELADSLKRAQAAPDDIPPKDYEPLEDTPTVDKQVYDENLRRLERGEDGQIPHSFVGYSEGDLVDWEGYYEETTDDNEILFTPKELREIQQEQFGFDAIARFHQSTPLTPDPPSESYLDQRDDSMTYEYAEGGKNRSAANNKATKIKTYIPDKDRLEAENLLQQISNERLLEYTKKYRMQKMAAQAAQARKTGGIPPRPASRQQQQRTPRTPFSEIDFDKYDEDNPLTLSQIDKKLDSWMQSHIPKSFKQQEGVPDLDNRKSLPNFGFGNNNIKNKNNKNNINMGKDKKAKK